MKKRFQLFNTIMIILLISGIFVLIISEDPADLNQEEDGKEQMEWIYGITIDDSWYEDIEIEAVVDAIRDMPVKPTVRIVMSRDIDPSDYVDLFFRLHEVAYVMACPVDSSEIAHYRDPESYLKRFKDSYEALCEYTDIWEVGNEINGDSWILQDTALVTAKVRSVNVFLRGRGVKTALTLYYERPDRGEDMFSWIDENLDSNIDQNLDYVFISYYEDEYENEGYDPNWSSVFKTLEEFFPNSETGIGECGSIDEGASEEEKKSKVRKYYSMGKCSPRFIGGFFWWNWVEDCVPHQNNPVYQTVNRSIADRQ